MHFKQDVDQQQQDVTVDLTNGQMVIWPFLLRVSNFTEFRFAFSFNFSPLIDLLLVFFPQNAMENPSCLSPPPETILALLWTTVAVFGIVYAILGYRCLRAIGFLSGLVAGASCIFWLQSQDYVLISKQADSGKLKIICFASFIIWHVKIN